MTYVCPRPDCTMHSEKPAYCRHGSPTGILPGNWMVDERELESARQLKQTSDDRPRLPTHRGGW